jgi:uncharacterized protein
LNLYGGEKLMIADSESIDLLVHKIVETVHPLRVLLFGSAARGDMTEGSDIDLLVVMPDGVHRRRTAQFLYQSIKGRAFLSISS